MSVKNHDRQKKGTEAGRGINCKGWVENGHWT